MQASGLNNGDITTNISTMMISQGFLQFCSAQLCYFSSFLNPCLSQSPHVSFIPFSSFLLPSLLNYQTLMCLCMSPFSLILCVKTGFSTFNQKMCWNSNPVKKVTWNTLVFIPLFYHTPWQGHLALFCTIQQGYFISWSLSATIE